MSFVSFGEIMLCLNPANFSSKINSSKQFLVDYAGSESNVVSSLGQLGNKVICVLNYLIISQLE